MYGCLGCSGFYSQLSRGHVGSVGTQLAVLLFFSLSQQPGGGVEKKKKKTNPDVIHGVVTDLAVVTRVGTTSPESHTCWTTPVGLICMHE